MPTRQHPGTRRSARVQGIKHNLLELTDSANQKPSSKENTKQKNSILTKEVAPRYRKSNEEEDVYVPNDDSSEEEETSEELIVSTKLHPLKKLY